jgi:phytoene dehydrogenase-like protein
MFKNENIYDIIVVGAGAAGLTSAAYLCKYGYRVLLCEKGEKTGGLVGSFVYNGFIFDSGIRAFENSGIIFPMLKQLKIDMEFVKNPVSIGIKNDIIRLESKESLYEYEKFLSSHFPDNKEDIKSIIQEIKLVMGYMDVLYGIDNPLFINLSENKEYLFKTLLPWLIKYQKNIKEASKLSQPINDYLRRFTDNQSLIDIISQHFFKNTPAFFALSYFGLYLDYSYPLGGTSVLAEKLNSYIKDNQGEILNQTEISIVDIDKKQVQTVDGKIFKYKKLIWASDTKRLYDAIEIHYSNPKQNKKIQLQKELVKNNRGGDSILTLYLGVDLDKTFFKEICGAHSFYTPKDVGLSSASLDSWEKLKKDTNLTDDAAKEELKKRIASYLELTTYEISCPVLRDASLAPEGKAGLIVSTLIDYDLVKEIRIAGWYKEFKDFCKQKMIDVLNLSIFEGIKPKVLFSLCSTPLTIESITGNSGGAITGWAFKNGQLPSETRFKKISKSVFTPLPDVYQAGQWTFSPSGLPISILTGKLAADEIDKKLRKKTGQKDRSE